MTDKQAILLAAIHLHGASRGQLDYAEALDRTLKTWKLLEKRTQ
jgi:hypothetical protein